MPFAEVLLKSIDVHNTDEDDSEWHLNIGANTSRGSFSYNWDADGVSDGDSYGLNDGEIFRVDPGEQIFIHAGGYEEDDPGFPLFDPNDGLPGFGFTIDPAALSAGDDYQVRASAGDFDYTLHWDINYFG